MGGGGAQDCADLLQARNEVIQQGGDPSQFDQQLQACSLSRGIWDIDANGFQGALVISSLDTSGNVEGSILGDQFTGGTWDTINNLLTFHRTLQGSSLVQHYKGAYIPYVDPVTSAFKYTLVGLFTQDTVPGSFGWFAQTTKLPDNLAPVPIHKGT